MEPKSSVTDSSVYYLHHGRQQLSVGRFGVIQPGEVRDISLGSIAEISDFLSAEVGEVSPLPDTSDSSTSSPHEGT